MLNPPKNPPIRKQLTSLFVFAMMLACFAIFSSATVHGGVTTAVADDSSVDAAVAEIKRAMQPDRDNVYVEIIRALRFMNDPSLEPLFSRLASEAATPARIQSILGLAEISDSGQIDLWQINRLPNELARLQAIGRAVSYDMISTEQLRELLTWEDLQESPRIAVYAELVKRGETVDIDTLRKLRDESTEQSVINIASCLLVEVVSEKNGSPATEEFEPVRTYLTSLTEDEKNEAELWLVSDIARYQLEHMFFWLEELMNRGLDSMSLPMRASVIGAGLQFRPEKGIEWWEASFSNGPSAADRIRHLQLLLAAANEDNVTIQAAVFEKARNGETLTEHMIDLGVAIAQRTNIQPAIQELIKLDHQPSTATAIVAAEKHLEPSECADVYTFVITLLNEKKPPSPRAEFQRNLFAVRCTQLLAELDIDRALKVLANQPDNSRAQEAMLVGLMGVESPRMAETVKSIKRIGRGHADSLTLILLARYAESLNEADLNNLGMIASGGGNVAPPQRVQAAWLYLKHADKIEYAMAEMF